jgi:hypothetical protein
MRELEFQNVVLLVIEIGLPPLHISGFLLCMVIMRVEEVWGAGMMTYLDHSLS